MAPALLLAVLSHAEVASNNLPDRSSPTRERILTVI